MPSSKKKEKSKRKKRSFGAELQWVKNNLDKGELDDADTRHPTPEQIMEFCMACVDVGIDLKIGWDEYSSCYQATAVGIYDGYPSAGHAVSARSTRDVFDALVLIWYKVEVLAEGDLSNLMTDQEAEDFRG